MVHESIARIANAHYDSSKGSGEKVNLTGRADYTKEHCGLNLFFHKSINEPGLILTLLNYRDSFFKLIVSHDSGCERTNLGQR